MNCPAFTEPMQRVQQLEAIPFHEGVEWMIKARWQSGRVAGPLYFDSARFLAEKRNQRDAASPRLVGLFDGSS